MSLLGPARNLSENPTQLPQLRLAGWTPIGAEPIGVPVGLVLDACAVVAYNRQGELRLCDAPGERFVDGETNPDLRLHSALYTFLVKEGDHLVYNYSGPDVVIEKCTPVFGTADVSLAVKCHDRCCIMTGAITGLEARYIVPESEEQWFYEHFLGLMGFGAAQGDITSMCNAVTLRGDLNGDAGDFLFVPYAQSVVAAFIRPTGGDLAYQYHLRPVNLPPRILRVYLFVRFAWNILEFSGPYTLTVEAVERAVRQSVKKRKFEAQFGIDNNSREVRARI
ncbi:hypothetical protein C8J57DRAFT_1729526 [Mycena rebaudengoi]|nr:hypothetical protein C8J57DRAFT_1729526 [Mycena rebaudengoi]